LLHKLRREIVFDFIKDNLGCKAEDIVEGLKAHLSRMTIYDILTELEKEKIIVNQKPNRRDNSYYPNKENQFVILKEEIREFRNSFSILLLNSKSNAKFINTLSIINSELHLMSDKRIKTKNLVLNEKKNFDKASSVYLERYELLNETFDILLRISKFGELKSNEHFDKKPIYKVPDEEYLHIKYAVKKVRSYILKADDLLKRYEDCIKETSFVCLILWAIYLFHLFVSSVTLKSVTRLSSITVNKDILVKLNKEILEEVIEINSELTTFLSLIKMINASNFFESIFNLSVDQKMVISQMIKDYSIFGLQEEIISVLKSLRKLRNFEIHDDMKMIDSMTKLCNFVAAAKAVDRKHKND
jgi:hypothetical protein